MNRYRVVRAPKGWPDSLPFRVGWEGHDRDYGVGEEFDREFTAFQEADNLASGLLEIVPREYRVIIEDSNVYGTPTGGTFMAALLKENEAALIAGGFIERVEPAQNKRKKVKS